MAALVRLPGDPSGYIEIVFSASFKSHNYHDPLNLPKRY